MLAPASSPALVEDLHARGVTALALDAVPRISRAQALDVLSTMSNVAGYRAVVEAAEAYGGMFTGQVTAAGKTPPARVFVIGAGVAGLAAIGAAGSMGARVRAFDVRPEVGEQIESMGATFVQTPESQSAQQAVERRRVRQCAHAGAGTPDPGDVRRRDGGRGHRHHDRAGARARADHHHRGDGRRDAARQRDRRPRRVRAAATAS